jgi:predicted metal-binding protein
MGRNISNRKLQAGDEMESDLKELIALAYSSGASDAKVISPDNISVEDNLANFCNEVQCKNYGLAPSCPPHVSGPSGFRRLQKSARYAIALRIAVPSAALFSDEREEIMRLLHEVTAGVEQAAIKAGYPGSKAFAGGSCKANFCYDHADCRVLSEGGECRYPKYARPSMSGFGINVSELMKVCGWPADIKVHEAETDAGSMSWVAGLILIAKKM